MILARRTVSGACSSSIGAFVVINPDGWFITAGHVAQMYVDMLGEEKTSVAHEAQVEAIRADSTLTRNQRQAALRKLGKLSTTQSRNAAAIWAVQAGEKVNVDEVRTVPAVDIGLGQLKPFKPEWVKSYPKFKNPTGEFEPGTSLCRLGFPFHGIKPTWDPDNNGFGFPTDAFPVPRFPIEGIATRQIGVVADPQPPFRTMMLETSSPGLRGQSGGPIFNSSGVVWGI